MAKGCEERKAGMAEGSQDGLGEKRTLEPS